MRTINISNAKGRNARVGFEMQSACSRVVMVRRDKTNFSNVRLLKTPVNLTVNALFEQLGPDLTDTIIMSDPEIDMERSGMLLKGCKKVVLTKDGTVAHSVKREQVFLTPEGEVKEVRPYHTALANINVDFPLRWTGRLIPKEKAARKFVFVRKYQLRHVDGLSYDFLYDMARILDEKQCLMLVGAGEKGSSPLVMAGGGIPYRAFLEGRIQGDRYCLILHLTNLELKALNV